MKIFAFILLLSFKAYSASEIRLVMPEAGGFSRTEHSYKVLTLALDKTKHLYGDYFIKRSLLMTRNRALSELERGSINVYAAPTRNEWEDRAIPVYFPISKGLLSYRLLLIQKSKQPLFSKITSTEEIKKLSAGLGAQWSTTKVLKSLQYKTLTSVKYKSLFPMLNSNRFDYFLRGVNEIFGEYSSRKAENPTITIEKDLIVYIPQPIYLFVSPKEPKLALRIKKGLELALIDGSFERLFLESHGENIKKVHFSKRRILNVGNPLLRKHEFFKDRKYWFVPSEN